MADDVDEYSRDDRIETYYQGWGARDMAERIVELEDEAEAAAVVESDRIAGLDARDAEIERLRKKLKEAQADSSYFEGWATGNGHRLNAMTAERDRYRLAWLSARRRAAEEANFGMEALELKEQEIRHLRAELAAQRQTTDAPRLEYAGDDEGGEIWRLASPETS